MSMSAPLSYPEKRTCWICNAVKVVLRVVNDFPHRMCPNCDRGDRIAHWQSQAGGEGS